MPKRQSSPDLNAVGTPDVFFDVFRAARMTGEVMMFGELQCQELRSFPLKAAYFHHVEGASCELRVAGSRRKLLLQPGDLVFLLQGHAHRIQCTGDASARITTGVFHFESPNGEALTQALPQWLHVRDLGNAPSGAPENESQWLAVTLAAMRLEAERPTLGSAVMLSRLIDLLFIWAVRHWLASAPEQPRGWIAALQDPVIGKALTLLHSDPAHDWSVEALAERLHQSRSNLSQRFVALVGEPPIRYLTRWRMQLAANLLACSRLRISQIAERVGYDSEPAFSRAFRRAHGVAPIEYRNTCRKTTGQTSSR